MTAGTVRGQVVWEGPIPQPPPILASMPTESGGYRWTDMPNPFAPQIDPMSRGLAGAVVSLKEVDPAASRPWDHPPVRVELAGFQMHVTQGHERRRVGLVRRGDEITTVSHDPAHHMLRGRGAAFFTLALPRPEQPRTRVVNQAGHVELTSGAGHFWIAADLFVSDHTYFTLTDQQGRFTLPAVPPGKYDLVCWVRNWHPIAKERDPETGLTFRERYAAPTTKHITIDVPPRTATDQRFTLSLSDFPPR